MDFGYYISSKIDHLLKVRYRNIEKNAHSGRHSAQKPYMRHRSRKLDVPHALAANYRAGNLDSTFFTDNVFVADPAVFSAVTFVIFFRAEYFLVKKASALGTPCAVIYSLGLGNFSKRPFFYLLGAG